jgi:hypothetical protein
MLADDLMPVYDVSDAVAIVVHADLASTWDALMRVDLLEVGKRRPWVGALGALRAVPEVVSHLLHGELPPAPPASMTLRDLGGVPAARGGWVRLAEREREAIALGLVGRFWRPVIEYRDVTPDAFAAFDEPGFAKTVYALSVRPLGPSATLLEGVMRTATTDEHARRLFRRYWTFGVGSGAHVLVQGLLDVTREMAEAAAAVGSTVP